MGRLFVQPSHFDSSRWDMPVETKAKVMETIKRTHNVKSVRFVPEEIVGFKAGQFLTFTVKESEGFSKYLSISNSPTEKDYLEVTKKLTGSDFSKAVDALKPGDEITVKYPLGNFTYREGLKKIAFLSGGIGITPIRSICKYLTDTKSEADVVLLYANNTSKDIAFKDDFDKMRRENPNLKVVNVICENGEQCDARTGRITEEVVKEEIPDFKERTFYVCGPPGMVEAMKSILFDCCSIERPRLITENFAGYK